MIQNKDLYTELWKNQATKKLKLKMLQMLLNQCDQILEIEDDADNFLELRSNSVIETEDLEQNLVGWPGGFHY